MSNWDVVYTKAFYKDFQKCPADVISRFNRFLSFLKEDPYRENNNAGKLKNQKHSYRYRFGGFRLLYRIPPKEKRVVLRRILGRDGVYAQKKDSESVIGSIDIIFDDHQIRADYQTVETLIPAKTQEVVTQKVNTISFPDKPSKTTLPIEENLIEIESVLIDIDELYLIRIPPEFHEIIQAADTTDDLETCELPNNELQKITSYLESPGQTHIGALYSLSSKTGDSIKDAPLSSFMLAPDLLQQSVIDKDLDSGPLLVRGGPGTGKSLIGLQRLRRVISERKAETPIFDSTNPTFAFISYTNSLVNTSEEIFKTFTSFNDVDIQFSTLDLIVKDMLTNYYQRIGEQFGDPVGGGTLTFRLKNLTLMKMVDNGNNKQVESAKYVQNNFTLDFLAEEIESVIEGNDLKNKADYLNYKRVGRKTPLRKNVREYIWVVYEVFHTLSESENKFTWSGRRQKLLHLIENGDITSGNFNALVLDEAQDLSVVSLRIVTRLVSDTRFLLMLADSGQSIYNKSLTWKNIHEDLHFHRGNSINLSKSYRMSQQLSRALQPLRRDADIDPNDPIKKTTGVYNGDKPVWLNSPYEQHSQVVIDVLEHLIYEQKINAGQIAVILRNNKHVDGTKCTIINDLLANNFSVDIFEKKKPIDIHGDSVHIINVHSAKGLEFPFVIVPFVIDQYYPSIDCKPQTDDLNIIEEWSEQEQRLLYVALSRASYRLWLISDKDCPSPYLASLNPRHWVKRYG